VPVTACEANAVVNATLPPDEAEPDTTRSALSLCVVDFVHPVGAEVCTNSMTVPAGIFAHAPENVVAVTVPVTLTPPEGTETPLFAVSVPVMPAPPAETVRPLEAVSVLVAVSVPVTVLLPVIAAPPDDTVNALLTPNVPVTVLLPVIPAPPDDTVRPPDDTVTPD
jgi:hypothetical protein